MNANTIGSEFFAQLITNIQRPRRRVQSLFQFNGSDELKGVDIMEESDDEEEQKNIMGLDVFQLLQNQGLRQERRQTRSYDFYNFSYTLQKAILKAIVNHPKQSEWMKTLIPCDYNLHRKDKLLFTMNNKEYYATPLALTFVFHSPVQWLQKATHKRIRAETNFIRRHSNNLWCLLWDKPYILWDAFAVAAATVLKHTGTFINWWAILSEFAKYANGGSVGKFTHMFIHSPMVGHDNKLQTFEGWTNLMLARKQNNLTHFIIPRVKLDECKVLFPYYKEFQKKHLLWEHLPWRHMFLKVSLRHASYRTWFSMRDKIAHIHHLCFHAYHNSERRAIPFVTSSLFSDAKHLSQCGFFETLDTFNKKQIFYNIFFPGLTGLESCQDLKSILNANLDIPYTFWIRAYISNDTSKAFLTSNPKMGYSFLSFWKHRGIDDDRLVALLRWTNCIDAQTGLFMLDKLCRLATEHGPSLASVLEINDRVIVSPDAGTCRFNPKRLALLKSPFVSPLMKRVLWQNTHYMYDVTGHVMWRTDHLPVLKANKMMFNNITVRNMAHPVSLDNHALSIFYDRKNRMVDFSRMIQVEFMEAGVRPPQYILQNQVTILFHKEVGIGEGVRQEVLQCIWDDAIKDGMFMWADYDETCLIPGPGEFGEEKLYNMARLIALCIHQGLFLPYRLHDDFWEVLCECIINEDRLTDMEDHFVTRWMQCQNMYAELSKDELVDALGLDEKEATMDKDTIIRTMSLPSPKTIKTFVRGWKNSLPGTYLTMFKGEWNDMFCEKLWHGGELRSEFEDYFTYENNDYRRIVDEVYRLPIENQKQFFFFVTGKKRPPQIQRNEQRISIQPQNNQQVRSATCSSQLFVPPMIPIDAEAIVASTTGDYKDGFAVQ